MSEKNRAPRVLIYSHDTFGLGHLRRCRTIAHALVARYPRASVLILSGSPIIGQFDFGDRVDFVRVPGVIKRRDGEYVPLKLDMGLEETISLREEIIRHTAKTFSPDLLIVDKEPLGLRGEMARTLAQAKARGCRLVLGLRDILDDPELLVPEWERKEAVPALEAFYDDIWIFGLQSIHNPLRALNLSDTVRRKIHYTGYLQRNHVEEDMAAPPGGIEAPERPFLLVTPGGGGDGDGLVDWVLSAYEQGGVPDLEAVIVLGPFMQADMRARFFERAAALPQVQVLTFDSRIERLMAKAAGIVAMGGYNTFCEILSHDKPGLILPRIRPRREQLIRAVTASHLGLVSMIIDPLEAEGQPRDPAVMARALRALPAQAKPSSRFPPGLMGGLDEIARLSAPFLARAQTRVLEGAD